MKKVKPYELVPGHVFKNPSPVPGIQECKVDRVIINSPTVVDVIANGGHVMMFSRDQDLELVEQA